MFKDAKNYIPGMGMPREISLPSVRDLLVDSRRNCASTRTTGQVPRQSS